MATSQQKSLFHDYEEFVEKFNPKKTTDDCYTPPEVYEAVRDWACGRYGIDPDTVMRPFYPGGDYMAEEYPEGCCVIDNPPFSILRKICRFYVGSGVPFFLFAPALTTLSPIDGVCAICTGAEVVYENGAKVSTSFLTNLEAGVRAMSCRGLLKAVREANASTARARAKPELPKYEYPDAVVTAAKLEWYSKHGTDFAVGADSVYVTVLDSQAACGKAIFGGGLLLSEKAAAEKAAAEKAAAEKAAAHRWPLSDREREIQRMLARRGIGVPQ